MILRPETEDPSLVDRMAVIDNSCEVTNDADKIFRLRDGQTMKWSKKKLRDALRAKFWHCADNQVSRFFEIII